MASLAQINIKFVGDLAQFSSSMQNAQRQLNSMGKKMQSAGKAMTLGLSAPLTAFGGLAVKTFADFEQEMAKVAAISGAAGKEFEALEANAKKLGATTRYTASEVAALQLNYSKLGFDPSEILKVTGATLDLALATGEDLAESARVAAGTLRSFNLDASQMARVTDVMADSFSASALDLAKFTVSMGTIGPVANALGQSLEMTAAQLGTLVDNNIDASTAGTMLRNMMLKATADGFNMMDALRDIATSTDQAATSLKYFDVRATATAVVLANNIEKVDKLTTRFVGAKGAAGDMAKIMDDTLQGSLFRLKSAFEGLQIEIGQQLKPVVEGVANALGKMAGYFSTLTDAQKKALVVMGGFAAAAGPLLALAGTILPAIASGFTLLAGPVGLVVAGLTAVGVIIYKNWQPIKQTLVDIANYFIDLYNESLAFRIVVEGFTFIFKNMWDSAKFTFNSIVSVLKAVVKSFANGFKIIGTLLEGALTLNPDKIKEAWGQFKDGWVDVVGGLADDLDKDGQAFFQGVQDNWKAAIEAGTKKAKLKLNPDQVKEVAAQVAGDPAGGAGGGKSRKRATAITGVTKGGTTANYNEQLLKDEIARLEPLVADLRKQVFLYPDDQEAKQQLASYEQTILGFRQRLETGMAGLPEVMDETVNSTKRVLDIGPILEGAAAEAVAGFASIVAGIATGNATLGDLFGFLINMLADVAIQIGKAAIKIGVAMAAVKLSFSNPLAAIAAGAALVLAGSLMKSLADKFGASGGGGRGRATAFANGGIVSGPTLALVGEYPGAANNPEVIAPLDKLKEMIGSTGGSQQVNLQGEFKLDGRNLKLALDRTEKTLVRTS